MKLFCGRNRCLDCGALQSDNWTNTAVLLPGYGWVSLFWCEACTPDHLALPARPDYGQHVGP
jgi:hypothetical protein